MSNCMSCRTLEADLQEAHILQRTQMQEICLLRNQAKQAMDELASYKAVHAMSCVAQHDQETPISLLPLIVEAMALLSESQGHQLRFEQLQWADRRDAVLKQLKELVEGAG